MKLIMSTHLNHFDQIIDRVPEQKYGEYVPAWQIGKVVIQIVNHVDEPHQLYYSHEANDDIPYCSNTRMCLCGLCVFVWACGPPVRHDFRSNQVI